MSIDQPSSASATIHPPATVSPATVSPASTSGRKRPLRTYSRRSVQAREPALGSSLRDTTEETARAATSLVELPQLPELSADQQQSREAPPSRSSILAYFKPLPPSSHHAPTDAASASILTTPPPSAPPLSESRKRRRLTTRPVLSEPRSQPDDGTAECIIGVGGGPAEEAEAPAACDPKLITIDAQVEGGTHGAARPALRPVAANAQQHPGGPGSADGTARSKRRADKRPVKDMTQTTLSLSVHKEPGYTICGVCDILYNPLNEKDRKEHNRRHAAHSRIQKKAMGR